MNFNEQDRLREIERLVAQLQRDQSYTPVRDPVAVELGMIAGVAGELIMPGASGSITIGVTSVTVRNATGHPVWKYSTVWVDAGRKYIISSNSANLLWGEWDDALTKFDSDSYALQAANKDAFDDTGFTGISPYDPAGLLADISSSEPWVLFATGEDEPLTVVATSAGGSGGGGGGDPWTGWPGPDPTTGVAPGIVFLAHVDETDPVAGTDADFEFDATTSMIGTAPASGTALNLAGRSFLPGEPILVFGNSTPTYYAFKVSENIATAAVNEATGVKFSDTEFDLDTFDAIIGLAPASGKCTNIPAAQYSDDQIIKVIFGDDAKWKPLETYQAALFETTSTITARSGSYTWGTGTGKLLAKTGAGTHSETGATTGITLYNSSQDEIAIDRIVQCKKIDGQWFIDVDDCT